jgi:hypothetical protein
LSDSKRVPQVLLELRVVLHCVKNDRFYRLGEVGSRQINTIWSLEKVGFAICFYLKCVLPRSFTGSNSNGESGSRDRLVEIASCKLIVVGDFQSCANRGGVISFNVTVASKYKITDTIRRTGSSTCK